ncbi:ran-binding protein 3-like isoform X1 [Salvelinus fontinalis]|uniref:ran-binding protein 3-like isoform X1 n=1 Tax=Salvelinus fontinalis TaxID=8038 RepID=UPI002485A8AD|nr:ran-binding protein 3-like isoform X1 [Salvelinus fontinalis]
MGGVYVFCAVGYGCEQRSKMAELANEEKPAIAPPVFLFQKDKAQKRSADGSSAEDEGSDKEDGGYCPPLKRERTSSLTQFPPSHSGSSKNNVFMPSSFCQSPTGNSEDSEPDEKPVGFRLKPPTLIHGQAPSSDCVPGVPSQKPKEQQRSVLRPALLQAPQVKSNSESTNGVKKSSDGTSEGSSIFQNNTEHSDVFAKSPKHEREDGASREKNDCSAESSFVFGQNIKDRAKLEENSKDGKLLPLDSQEGTNYFLQYIATPSSKNAIHNTDKGAKFVFGQNMSERVLSPSKGGEASVEDCKVLPAPPVSESSSKENIPEKGNNVTESLEESAAAYTKATAKKCILEKVDVKTGEESESNVLQVQCKLFVFDKTAQTWIERGRGLLRLNDMASTDDGSLQSRLVMRTQGSLRLILNTKLWPQMQVDKASEKSVRVTAMDTEDQGVKVFLISASSREDTGQLAAALHHRILALKSRADQEPQEAPAADCAPEADLPHSEGDSDEEDQVNNAAVNSEGGEAQAAGST